MKHDIWGKAALCSYSSGYGFEEKLESSQPTVLGFLLIFFLVPSAKNFPCPRVLLVSSIALRDSCYLHLSFLPSLCSS